LDRPCRPCAARALRIIQLNRVLLSRGRERGKVGGMRAENPLVLPAMARRLPERSAAG
jgi:hypothetical protein